MARLGVNVKAPRQPHWPDRAAHLRRRRARKVFWVVAGLLLVLPWLGYRSVRDWIGPGAADPPAVPVATSARPAPIVAPVVQRAVAPPPVAPAGVEARAGEAGAEGQIEAIGRDAELGDEDQVVARLASLDARAHHDAMLADRGSAIRREAARREVETMAGVRAAGWVDRMSMVVLASAGGMNGYQAISEACRRLGAHGDVTGVAITVQEVAAGARRPASSLTAECAPDASGNVPRQVVGGRLLPGRVLGPGATAGGAAAADGAATDAELEARRARQAESLRILSESTPALPEPH